MSNTVTLEVTFNPNDTNAKHLKRCIWMIAGVMIVKEVKE